MKSISDLPVNIPEWAENDFEVVNKSKHLIEKLAQKAGTGSDKFVKAVKVLKGYAEISDKQKIVESFEKPIYVRAFTSLLANDAGFINQIGYIDKVLVDGLRYAPRVSQLSFEQLIRAYFTFFDELSDEENLWHLCSYIKDQLKSRSKGNETQLIKNRDIIFSDKGPKKIFEFAYKNNIDLDTLFKKLDLLSYLGGRYYYLVQTYYYIETLNRIPVGEDHSILQEIVKKDVYSSPFEGRQLGHAILEILIDRAGIEDVSPEWQRAVLSIAGDPRVPPSRSSYQQWWSLIDNKYIDIVKAWLSKLDLKLFLEVLEQSAKDLNEKDIERMFKSRKIFMEGLLKKGYVKDSRLFLSRNADRYIRTHYDKDELPLYAHVESNDTSMIYLNINGLHMFEGSHNFKIKILEDLPTTYNEIVLYKPVIWDHAFRSKMDDEYFNEYNTWEGYFDSPHDQHLNWQHKALGFINQFDLDLRPEDVLSKSQYHKYKKKFGIKY